MVDQADSDSPSLAALFGSPDFYVTFAVGLVLLAAALIRQNSSPILFVFAILILAVSVAVFFYRKARRTSWISRDAVEELRISLHQDHKARLNQLAPALQSDHDPRSENVYKNIQSFDEMFGDRRTWANKLTPQHAKGIIGSIHSQFEAIANSLDIFLDLWQRALRISDTEHRRPYLDQRNTIMGAAQDCIQRLLRTMGYIQRLGTDEEAGPELARIEKEISENLVIARHMEEEARECVAQLSAD